jgi:hypothetical protein
MLQRTRTRHLKDIVPKRRGLNSKSQENNQFDAFGNETFPEIKEKEV